MNANPPRKPNRTPRREPDPSAGTRQFLDFVLGRDLPWRILALAIAIFGLQVACQFALNEKRPVTGTGQAFFQPKLKNQNSDVYDWVLTGLLLPDQAMPQRAPRPLWPSVITFSRSVGLVSVPQSGGMTDDLLLRCVRILQSVNVAMTLLCGWFLFAAFRYFDHRWPSALGGTVLALSGFGFSFWTNQAVPEVLSYFSVGLVLAALMALHEAETRNAPAWRFAPAAWAALGLLVGILTLGKELYNLTLFVALLLLWRRRWLPLGLFLVCSVIPVWLWRFYIVNVRHIFDPVAYSKAYPFVVWLRDLLLHAPMMEKLGKLGANLDTQVSRFFQAFAYIPVFFAIVGAAFRSPRPGSGPVAALFLFSLSALFVASNFIMPRIAFLAWPFVYFYAWRGIGWCADGLASVLPRPGPARAVRVGFTVLTLVALVWLQNQMLFDAYYYG